MKITKTAATILFMGLINGCAHIPQGYQSSQAPKIKIVKYAELQTLTVESKLFSMNFGNQADGTHVVEQFLKKAQEAGGLYVTDLAMTFNIQKDNDWTACTTTIDPKGATVHEHTTRFNPGQAQSKYVLKPASDSWHDPLDPENHVALIACNFFPSDEI